MKLEISKTYLVKNLTHVITQSGVPAFKSTVKTVFKKSSLENEDTQDFSEEEDTHLKSLDTTPFYVDPAPMAEVHQPGTSTDILSLLQFTQLNPRDIRPNQFVEVFEV